MAELFARILAEGLGMRTDALEAMLSAYKHVCTQESYTPEFIAKKRLQTKQLVIKKTKKKLDDEALLRKLEGFTASDEKGPARKAGSRRR